MPTSLQNPGLVYLADKAIIAAAAEIACIKDFCWSLSDQAIQPGTTMKVNLFDSAPARVFNRETNNYETVDGTVTQAEISFDTHLKKTFMFTDKDFLLVNVAVWDQAGEAGGVALAQAILSAISDKINKTNIPKSGPCATGGTFGAANEYVLATATKKTVAKLRKAARAAGIAPRRSVLALCPDHYADILAELDSHIYNGDEAVRLGRIPGLYGFKSVVEMEMNDGEGENLVGAVIPDQAIGIAGRAIEVQSPSNYQEVGMTVDEGSGLPITIRRHGSPKYGENFVNMETLFGGALLQANKIVRLVSSATAA